MEQYFVLTEEMVKKAKTYMPLLEKEKFAQQISDIVVKPKDTAEQNKIGNLPLPELFFEDITQRNYAFLSIVLGYYFDITMEDKGDVWETYDFYAGKQIFNQLERFKSNPELKEIVFDLVADIKDFRKMIDVHIENDITNRNDPLGRLGATMTLLGDPESVKAMLAEVNKLLPEKPSTAKQTKAPKAKQEEKK